MIDKILIVVLCLYRAGSWRLLFTKQRKEAWATDCAIKLHNNNISQVGTCFITGKNCILTSNKRCNRWYI